MQLSVALEGGPKTLCFRWPWARECDGDPTGPAAQKGSATNNQAQGPASNGGPPQSHCTAQAPVCASTAQSQNPNLG